MSKATKKGLIIGSIILVTGLIAGIVVYKLNPENRVTKDEKLNRNIQLEFV